MTEQSVEFRADTEVDPGVAGQSSTMGNSQSSCDNQSEDEDDKSLTSNYSTRNRTIWNNRKAEPLIGNSGVSVEYLDLINETSGYYTFDESVKTRISQVLTLNEEKEEDLESHDSGLNKSHVSDHVTDKVVEKKIIHVESLISQVLTSNEEKEEDLESHDSGLNESHVTDGNLEEPNHVTDLNLNLNSLSASSPIRPPRKKTDKIVEKKIIHVESPVSDSVASNSDESENQVFDSEGVENCEKRLENQPSTKTVDSGGDLKNTENDDIDGDQSVLIEKESTKISLQGIDNMAADLEEESVIDDETCKSGVTDTKKMEDTDNIICDFTTEKDKKEDVFCDFGSENSEIIDDKCHLTCENNEIIENKSLLTTENDDIKNDKSHSTCENNNMKNDQFQFTSEGIEMDDDVCDFISDDNSKVSDPEVHGIIDNEIVEGDEDSNIDENKLTNESNSLSNDHNSVSQDSNIVEEIENSQYEHDKSGIVYPLIIGKDAGNEIEEKCVTNNLLNFSESNYIDTRSNDNPSTISETDNEHISVPIDHMEGSINVCTCESKNNQKPVCHENCQVVKALFTKDIINDNYDQNRLDYLNSDNGYQKSDNHDQSRLDYMNSDNHDQCTLDHLNSDNHDHCRLDYLNSDGDSFESSQSVISCDNKSDYTDDQIYDKDDNLDNHDFIDNCIKQNNHDSCDTNDLNSEHLLNQKSNDICDHIEKEELETVNNNNKNDMNHDHDIHDIHDINDIDDIDDIDNGALYKFGDSMLQEGTEDRICHEAFEDRNHLTDSADLDQGVNQYNHDNDKVNNLVQKSPKKREFTKHENEILYSVKEETDDELEKELQCTAPAGSSHCSICSENVTDDDECLQCQITSSDTDHSSLTHTNNHSISAKFVHIVETKSCDCTDSENCVHYPRSIYQSCVQNGANVINNNNISLEQDLNDSENLLLRESLLNNLNEDDEKHLLEHELEKHLSDEEHHLHSDSLLTDDKVCDNKHLSENDQFADDDYLSVEDGAYMTCSDNEQDGQFTTDTFVRHSQPESGFGETISSDFTLSEKDLKISANEHFESRLSDTEVENYEVPGPEEVFEDADEYYHGNHHENDSADIEWDAGSLCGCPDCLAQLHLERIVTADKCTMCPEEPPYVMMCEICEELLENQLQKTEKDSKKKEADLKKQLKGLKEENEKQQKIIQQNLQLGPEAKIEATMQHEITRLTSENLDLRETLDKNQDQIRKLKKMLKVYSKRLKDGEAAEIAAEIEKDDTQTNVENVASIKHRERNYMGMLEYRKEDESALIKNLIMDLKPRVAVGLLPGLPSYVLFMCVRHTDYVNDDEKVRGLLTNTINGMKKCVKKYHSDIERVMLWLANTCRLLHTLKQYSGEKAFQADNTARQNEHCLRNFDLSEYRQVFSDLAVWIYQTLIKQMQETVQQMIVPAVLEHEAIAGLTASKPSGMRGRSSSTATDLEDKELSLDSLMKVMNKYSQILTQHAVDPELVKQIFRQLYYFVGSGALNNLLLRKDMCNWSKGMQIRYNLSHLEQWLRDNKLQESGALSALEPITQASQLLQARKTDADVDSICEMCSKLTTPQIVKILNLYTPVDEFEERVPISFIRKIQQKLKGREEAENTLLMDTKYSFPVTFPFNPSSIALETIEVPQQLHLGFLNRH